MGPLQHLRRFLALIVLLDLVTGTSSSSLRGGYDDSDEDDIFAGPPAEDPYYSHLVNLYTDWSQEAFPPKPFMWHIPKAAGSTMHELTSNCLGLLVASSAGRVSGTFNQTQLEELRLGKGHNRRHINVDLSSLDGIRWAHGLGLHETVMGELIFSALVRDTVRYVFSPQHKGIMFTMFRHPVQRIESEFFYLQTATWERTYRPEYKDMTLMEFYTQPRRRNWMVGMLVGKDVVDDVDLMRAKRILRNHVVIGLAGRINESLRKLGQVFSWNQLPHWGRCVIEYTKHGSNAHAHPHLPPSHKNFKYIANLERLDMELYGYALQLFEEQKESLLGEGRQVLNDGVFVPQ